MQIYFCIDKLNELMRRIAIPISDEKISPKFGECEIFRIYEVENEMVLQHYNLLKSEKNLENLPDLLANENVTDAIVNKIDKSIISSFMKKKINLFIGFSQEDPDLLIEKYLDGSLNSDKKIIEEIVN